MQLFLKCFHVFCYFCILLVSPLVKNLPKLIPADTKRQNNKQPQQVINWLARRNVTRNEMCSKLTIKRQNDVNGVFILKDAINHLQLFIFTNVIRCSRQPLSVGCFIYFKFTYVKGRIHCEIFLSRHFMKYSFRVISWNMK